MLHNDEQSPRLRLALAAARRTRIRTAAGSASGCSGRAASMDSCAGCCPGWRSSPTQSVSPVIKSDVVDVARWESDQSGSSVRRVETGPGLCERTTSATRPARRETALHSVIDHARTGSHGRGDRRRGDPLVAQESHRQVGEPIPPPVAQTRLVCDIPRPWRDHNVRRPGAEARHRGPGTYATARGQSIRVWAVGQPAQLEFIRFVVAVGTKTSRHCAVLPWYVEATIMRKEGDRCNR